jgi:hypothetical protein
MPRASINAALTPVQQDSIGAQMLAAPAPQNSEEPLTCTARLNWVRLNRPQLDALINKCGEGLTDPIVRLSTSHTGERLSAATLTDLKVKVERVDGEVAKLTDLKIEVNSDSDKVEIEFVNHLAVVTVTSNETWALGRTEALRRFLRRKQARDWRPRIERVKAATAIAVCLATMAILAWLVVAERATTVVTLVVSALLALAFLTLAVAHWRARRKVELVMADALPAHRLLPAWVTDAVPFASSGIGLAAALVKAFG